MGAWGAEVGMSLSAVNEGKARPGGVKVGADPWGAPGALTCAPLGMDVGVVTCGESAGATPWGPLGEEKAGALLPCWYPFCAKPAKPAKPCGWGRL